LLHIDNRDQWMNALESCRLYDTYHLPEYHLLAKKQKEGEPFMFYFQHEEGAAALPMLIRKTSDVQGLEDSKSFDATSVYGYPGVVTNINDEFTNAQSFRNDFQKTLLSVFHDKNVISFFTRQNPLFKTSWLLQGIGDVLKLNNTVTIDLTQSDHEQEKNMSKGHRYDIKKAKKAGVIAYEDKEFRRIDDFILTYNQTMRRNGALDYYFFPNSYYKELKRLLKDKLKLFIAEKDGIIVGASMFLLTGKIIQYHLSGTPDEFLRYSGAKVILDEVRQWGMNNGYKWLHLGGGLGSTQDSLYRFKAGFSKLRIPFEIIKSIINPQIYRQLVKQRDHWIESNNYQKESYDYFPSYRAHVILTTER
jgi:hypothetical protein